MKRLVKINLVCGVVRRRMRELAISAEEAIPECSDTHELLTDQMSGNKLRRFKTRHWAKFRTNENASLPQNLVPQGTAVCYLPICSDKCSNCDLFNDTRTSYI
jgi:hypothetical protein